MMNVSANRRDRRSLDSQTPGMSGSTILRSFNSNSLSRAVLQVLLMSSVVVCHAQVSSDVNTASEQRSASTVAKRAEARVGSTEISKQSVTEQIDVHVLIWQQVRRQQRDFVLRCKGHLSRTNRPAHRLVELTHEKRSLPGSPARQRHLPSLIDGDRQ